MTTGMDGIRLEMNKKIKIIKCKRCLNYIAICPLVDIKNIKKNTNIYCVRTGNIYRLK